MIRLLHLADVHLGAPFGGFGREAAARGDEVLDAFRRVPDLASDGGAHAVVISGDLFDGPRPDERLTVAVREVVRKLVERHIPVFAVPGNHDARALAPDLYPTVLEGAHVFEAARIEAPVSIETPGGPLHVYGFAYDRAEEPDPLSTFERADVDGVHVLLAHGSTPGAPHWVGGSSLTIPWESLAGLDVDYVALGDLHRFRGPEELEGAPACYPGSFAAVDLTESGTRGAVWVDVTPGEAPRLELVSSGVREVLPPRSVDVSGCSSEPEVVERIASLAENGYPVVALEGEPSFPLDADSVRAGLDERYGACQVVDRSRFFDLGRLDEIAGQNTVAGHVARLGLEAVAAAEDDEARTTAEQGLRIALRVMEVS